MCTIDRGVFPRNLQKHTAGWNWPKGHCLSVPGLENKTENKSSPDMECLPMSLVKNIPTVPGFKLPM